MLALKEQIMTTVKKSLAIFTLTLAVFSLPSPALAQQASPRYERGPSESDL
jgi:hypothetical protein